MNEEELQKIADPDTWDLGYVPLCVERLIAEVRRLQAVWGLNTTLCEQNERAVGALDAFEDEIAKRKEDEQALVAEVERLKRMIDEGIHWDDLRETTPELPRD